MEPTRARLLARFTLATASLLAVSMPAMVATNAEAQLVTQADRCQADLAKTARLYLSRILKYRIRCESKVITGDLPLATDCLFGNGDDKLAKQLLRSEARLSVSGSDCNGVNLNLLGFPNLCHDRTGSPFDLTDFKECVLERTDLILDELLQYYYPPLTERQRGDVALCLQGTPEDALDALNGKMKARERCLTGQAYGVVAENVDCYEKILPYGSGTGDPKTDDALARAYVELLGNVPKACAITNINDLGYQEKCGDPTGGVFNIIDLKNCLFNADRIATLAELATVFPTEGICGDGNVTGEEECDLGIAGNSDSKPNTCRTNCKNPGCGDVIVDTEFGDQCDDGNSVDNDCCSNTCKNPVCGDGAKACTEQCDNGAQNANEKDKCRATGQYACMNPKCGDGIEDTGEQCDDGNTQSDDGCSSLCFDEYCGDEIIQSGLGEQCDDGIDNADAPDKCRATVGGGCKNPRCGDGIQDTGEGCDDGNTANGDSCSSVCQTPAVCGNDIKEAGEECDGNSNVCPGGEACADNCDCVDVCPTQGELILYAGYGAPCTTNSDCAVGVCDQLSGNCHTLTRLDSGWIGLAHNADINDATLTRGLLECDNGHGPTCGECNVTGIDAQHMDSCRCANDNQKVCDDKFNANSPDCGVCGTGDLSGSSCTVNADCASICTKRCSENPRKTCTSNTDCAPILGNGTCETVNNCANGTSCTTNAECTSTTCSGTTACNCFFGAPFPLASGGTPACVLNRFTADVTGTANVDEGSGAISAKLRTRVFLGISTTSPCPVCGGTCSNSATTFCVRDQDCPGGTCNDDPVANDGNKGGVCSLNTDNTPNAGQACDNNAFNASFPAFTSGPNGGWYSLDCTPAIGKNVSGQGLIINLTQTTGLVSLASSVSCTGPAAELDCPCLVCSADTSVPCNVDSDCSSLQSTCQLGTGGSAAKCLTNADCASASAGTCPQSTKKCSSANSISCTTNADCQNRNLGTCPLPTCSAKGSGEFPQPNYCENLDCSDQGGGVGLCTTGPDSRYCDAVTKANGAGVLSCNQNVDCDVGTVGIPAGNCTIVERNACFLDPITAQGDPDPSTPIGASVFCIPPTTNTGINSAAGLPGPGRVVNQAKARTFCGNDTSKQYIPGVGGCLAP